MASQVEGALLAALLSDTREIVARLLREPALPVEALAEQVRAYRDHILTAVPPSGRARTVARADLELAAALAARCLELLERVREADADIQRLAQVAVRYFVIDDDDDDLDSLFGFDDDVEVFNAVAERLGWTDLMVRPA